MLILKKKAMKKMLISIVLTFLFVGAFAQSKEAIKAKELPTPTFTRPPFDTLLPPSVLTGTPTYYITFCGQNPGPDTGYVVGPNCYGDLAKAQMYLFDQPYNVIGALVWIAKKRGSAGNVIFNVYAANGTGNATSGTVNYAPGTVLGSVTVPYANINAGTTFVDGVNIFNLPNPVSITSDYYVGLDFSQLGSYPANAFAIVSTSDGDAGGAELAWEKWDTGEWYSFLEAWPLDFDIFICPIIDYAASVQENFIHNLILNIYPNPVKGNAVIEYQLKNDAQKVEIAVLDMTGKTIFYQDMGAQVAGAYKVNFDVSQLTSGTYIYTVIAGKNRLAKTFNVE